MRLASFWGLPAPMLLLAFDEKESVLPYLRMLRYTVSGDVLSSLQKELCILRRVKDFAHYSSPMRVIDELGDLQFNRGSLVGSDATRIYKKEFVQLSAVRVTEIARNGVYKECSNLEQKADVWLSTQSFPITQTSRKVKEFVKGLEDCDSVDADMIASEYGLILGLPDVVVVDGQRRRLTDDEASVLRYFIDRIDDVEWLSERMNGTESKDDVVFGVPFFQLIRRKPESIRYAVLNVFEYVKRGSNAKVLTNLVASVRNDAKWFKEMYQKYVKESSISESSVMTRERLKDVCSGLDGVEFFECMVQENAIKLEDYSVDTFVLIVSLYERIRSLSDERICEKLGIGMRELDVFGRSMCDFGVCGINSHSVELFRESIGSITLSVNRTYRPKEIIERVEYILSNEVEALLDTLIPVGGAIGE